MTRRFPLFSAGAIGLAMAAWTMDATAEPHLLPGAVNAQIITRMLLGPRTWLFNFPDSTREDITANAILRFEMRGVDVVVKIDFFERNVSCEKPVTITAEGVAFDGCVEPGFVLRFTADDPVFAFRGANHRRWATLKPFARP